jgi:hypothetical protein
MADPFKTNVKSKKIHAQTWNIEGTMEPRVPGQLPRYVQRRIQNGADPATGQIPSPSESALDAHDWAAFDGFKNTRMKDRAFTPRTVEQTVPSPVRTLAPKPDVFAPQKFTIGGAIVPLEANMPDQNKAGAGVDSSAAVVAGQAPRNDHLRPAEDGVRQGVPSARRRKMLPLPENYGGGVGYGANLPR